MKTIKKLTDFESNFDNKEHLNSIKIASTQVSPKDFRPLVYTSMDGDDYKYVDFIRKFVYENNAIPVNPIETLNYYLSTQAHKGSKAEIIKDCFKLMLSCDELWVFTKPLSETSTIDNLAEGILAEIYVWLLYKKANQVKFYDWRVVGIPKYLPKSNWSLTNKEGYGKEKGV